MSGCHRRIAVASLVRLVRPSSARVMPLTEPCGHGISSYPSGVSDLADLYAESGQTLQDSCSAAAAVLGCIEASKQASKQGRAVPLEEKRKETQVSARN